MIALFLLLLVVLLGVLTCAIGLMGAREQVALIRKILARKTSSIGTLKVGDCEVAGVLSTVAPLSQGDGRKLAVVQATLSTTTSAASVLLCAPNLTVHDTSGSCLLLPERLAVLAGQRAWSLSLQEIEARFPLYLEAARTLTGGPIDVVEQTLEVGERVLVSGAAIPDVESASPDYRRGGLAMALTGHADEALLVSSGPEAAGLGRALLLLVMLGAPSLAGLLLLPWMGWVGVRLWW